MLGLRHWRRKRLRNRSFPSSWLQCLENNVHFYGPLPEADRIELQQHIQVFIAEKNFEGCQGLVITDEIKVTIAAYACRLLLHRNTDYYPGLYSILVYPSAFVAKAYQELTPGFYLEEEQFRSGESWRHGSIVLSWDQVQSDIAGIHPGHNVILHEFAHQLDTEDGKSNGVPILPERSHYIAWARILGRDFARLRQDMLQGRGTLIDPYGSVTPAEFFAVTTECFFEQPVEMRRQHPELYRALQRFYQQDPATLATLADNEKHSQRG